MLHVALGSVRRRERAWRKHGRRRRGVQCAAVNTVATATTINGPCAVGAGTVGAVGTVATATIILVGATVATAVVLIGRRCIVVGRRGIRTGDCLDSGAIRGTLRSRGGAIATVVVAATTATAE